MGDSHEWPADYFASRKQFIDVARASGASMDSYPVRAGGPEGEPLSVDIASFTSEQDEHLIIITSGVHGIEGFIGAFIQLRALQMLSNDGFAERVGIVMIHAVNPWGFAHLRRVDENNVDVNRNFFDSAGSMPKSHSGYAELDSVINPKHAPHLSGELSFWLQASKLIVKHRGVAALFKPIAEGQYDFAKGLFFGGSSVSQTCQLLQGLVLKLAADVERVTVLDLHSGLGPTATASLIGDTNLFSAEKRLNWLGNYYDQPVYVVGQDSNAYDASSTFSQWCRQALSDKRFLYLCVEIGTVKPVTLFSALRRENQAHHWSDRRSTQYADTKQSLLNVFAPPSRRWRFQSSAQGLHVIKKTIDMTP